MYIGPWQEYQLAKLLHREQYALSRHTTLARAGRILVEEKRGETSGRYPYVGSEASERSFYSAPVAAAPRGKKPLRVPKKTAKNSRCTRIPERIAKMRELYGLDATAIAPQSPAPNSVNIVPQSPLHASLNPLLVPSLPASHPSPVQHDLRSHPASPRNIAVVPTQPVDAKAFRAALDFSTTPFSSSLRVLDDAQMMSSNMSSSQWGNDANRAGLSPVLRGGKMTSTAASVVSASGDDLVAWANALRFDDLKIH
eukprot:GEMP01062128.1.p1 GENE.GEMP01062128.1~~GEMP01062128.1.p1  ORF type:complete len:254 (+),score=70.82 GEMP01062128.1:195-956(+)